MPGNAKRRKNADSDAAEQFARRPSLARSRTGDSYLVTVSAGDKSRKLIWDSYEPLELDHPVRHILVQNDDGLSVMTFDHSGRYYIRSHFEEGRVLRISTAELENRTPFEIDGLTIRITPLQRAQAAYLPDFSSHRAEKGTYFLSTGFGNVLTEFEEFGGSVHGRVGGKRAFRLARSGRRVQIHSSMAGLHIQIGQEDPQTLDAGVNLDIDNAEAICVEAEGFWWRINRVATPGSSGLGRVSLSEADEETRFFRRSAKGIVASVLIFAVMAWTGLIPSEPFKKPEPVVTTIQLRQPKLAKKEAPKPTPKPPEPKAPEPKIVEKKPEPKKIEPKKVEKKIAEKKKPGPKLVLKKPPKKIAPKIAMKPAPAPKIVRLAPKAAPPKKALPPPALARAVKPVPKPPTAAPIVAGPTPEQLKAQAQAKLAKSLSFLSAPPKTASKAVFVNEATSGTKYRSVASVASTLGKADGKSYLVSVANAAETDQVGVINTKTSRQIASDAGVTGGYGPGGKGKGLNEVQGKVTLAALYDPNAGDGIGESLSGGGGGGLQMSGSGVLDESALLKLLERYMQRFQYCYEKALLVNSTLSGGMTLQWTINPGGQASSTRVIKSQMNNAALHSCMTREINKIPFPSPKGGSVTVKFPFAFSATAL